MSGASVQPGATPVARQINHAGNVLRPQSCSDISSKIANLQRTISAAEQHFEAQLRALDQQSFGNKGIFWASIIKDSCVAFLDVGANVLEIVGMKQAATVASQGVNAIQISGTAAEWHAGQKSTSQALTSMAKTGVSALPTSSAAGQAGKFIGGSFVGAGEIAVNGPRQAQSETQNMAMGYARDQIIGTADLIAKAAEEGDASWGAGLGKVMNGVKGLVALQTYDQNLNKSMDAYFDEKVSIDTRTFTLKLQFRRKFAELKTQLRTLEAMLQQCLAENNLA
ncbi:hypothetical protein [Celeribacter sp.]|uniref:hypothetical protein n=1 Tax=Celeribacter sp. TaxID=1890673 RepID=UPI003A9484A2